MGRELALRRPSRNAVDESRGLRPKAKSRRAREAWSKVQDW